MHILCLCVPQNAHASRGPTRLVARSAATGRRRANAKPTARRPATTCRAKPPELFILF